jgi:PAS domain S-box-containing protein
MKKMPTPCIILVVDDEEKIRKSLSGLLQDYGYKVKTAGSGQECLQIMSSDFFELVILDIVMPGISGIEILEKIKEKYRETEVIMITGYADKDKAIATFRVGAYDFIEKPFESKEMLNTITHCLNQLEMRKEIKKKTLDLAMAEEKYRDLYDHAPDMYYSIDKEGYIIEVNQTMADTIGYSKEELIGHHLTEIYTEDSKKEFEKNFPVLLKQGSLFGLERRVVRRDGGVIDVSINVSVIYEEKGTPIKTRTIMRDITEKKRMENDLASEKERLLVTLRSIGDGVITTDTTGKIILMNKVAEELTGWTQEEATGRPYSVVFHIINEKTREVPEDPIVKVIKTGMIVELANHIVLIARDGTERVIADSGTPIKDKDGSIIGVVLVFRDITERRKIEEEFQKASKLESIGILAGGIAHEFNNLLTTIIGYGKLLNEEIKKDDPLRHNVDLIIASSERAASLTKDLLAFSREQIINLMPVRINRIIKNVEKLLLMVIGEDIELRTTLADEGAVIMADSGKIEQVLINLATNARDAMPDGGYLTISTELVELDEEYLNLKAHDYKKPGVYTLISVTDTGAGMDKKIMEKIFEPFFTTKEVGRGTGLGLSIVYGIIKQHNGYINVYSELGKGTTFKMYLPIVKSDVKETESAVSTALTGGTETVLVAEDNEEVRNLIKNILQKSGYKVIEAVDGEDAINKLAEDKDKIQLLIFDVIMPKKSGKEAYEEIKKIRPDIKALFTSGYAADIIQKKGVFEERFDFISKPISPKGFLKKVREILDQ